MGTLTVERSIMVDAPRERVWQAVTDPEQIVKWVLPALPGAQMTRSKVTCFGVLGGTLWVGGIVTVGYFFGNIPWVKEHLDKIIWAMILVPGLLVMLGAWRARKARA